MEVVNSSRNSVLEKILLNGVIGDTFCKYLSFKDMKMLRETCQTSDIAITKNKMFKDKCMLMIGKDCDLNVIQQSAVAWKNVHLKLYSKIFTDLLNYSEYLEQLLKNHIEYVHLDFDDFTDGDDPWNFANDIPAFCDGCQDFFKLPKIKEIRIHDFLLNTPINSSRILTAFCVDILKELNRITIYKSIWDTGLYLAREIEGFGRLFLSDITVENLRLAKENCKSLSGFHILFNILVNPAGADELQFRKAKNILDILKNNAITSLTLRDPTVFFNRNPNINGITNTLKLQSLKNVRLMSCRGNETLVQFIEKQPPFQSLELDLEELFPERLIRVISAKSSDLRNICLKIYSTEIYDSEREDENRRKLHYALNQWNFLRNLKYLEKFSFFRLKTNRRETTPVIGHCATVNRILTNLPKTINEVRLKNLICEPDVQASLSSLPLEQLTTLSLLRCQDVLDDTSLQLILPRLTNLQRLEIANCGQLTNFGLTGFSPPNSEVILDSGKSIKNIKGLKFLTLRKCPKLTAEIVTSLEFPFLIEIKLQKNAEWPSTVEMISSLVIQNPLLEKINVSQNGLQYSTAKNAVSNAIATTNGRCQDCQVKLLKLNADRRRMIAPGFNDFEGYESDSENESDPEGDPDLENDNGHLLIEELGNEIIN